jgi:hypothetical protein
MITRKQIGWILIVGSILLAIIGFLIIDWKEYIGRNFVFFLLQQARIGHKSVYRVFDNISVPQSCMLLGIHIFPKYSKKIVEKWLNFVLNELQREEKNCVLKAADWLNYSFLLSSECVLAAYKWWEKDRKSKKSDERGWLDEEIIVEVLLDRACDKEIKRQFSFLSPIEYPEKVEAPAPDFFYNFRKNFISSLNIEIEGVEKEDNGSLKGKAKVNESFYREGIYYKNWLFFCVILAFIGSILVITYKPKVKQ